MFHIGFRVDGSWVISPDSPVGFAVGNKVFHSISFLRNLGLFQVVSYLIFSLSRKF